MNVYIATGEMNRIYVLIGDRKMRVIKMFKRKIRCKACKCIFEYTSEDLKESHYIAFRCVYRINCPICKTEVDIAI